MDPSLRNWGLAVGVLDITDGMLRMDQGLVIRPKEETSKPVRKNSKDMEIAEILSKELKPFVYGAQVIFVEVPVGSQSARAMASYGVCVGILGAFRAHGISIIEVTALEVKQALTGVRLATKDMMIQQARKLYPDLPLPMHRGKIAGEAEHIADAIGAIHAGARTPMFQQLRHLYLENQKTP